MRYKWDGDCWRDRDGHALEAPDRICAPLIQSDIAAYESPLGTGMIDGRKARREDLKRAGCRAVDPDEYKPRFINEKFARKRGLPYDG